MNRFTCENPDNTVPRNIRNLKVQKGRNTGITGAGKVIMFQFARNH